MADQQIVQVSYGEVSLAPANAQEKTETRRDRIVAWLTFSRAVAVNSFVINFVVALAAVVVREMMRSPVVIEEISLPKAWTDRGYSSEVAAQRLWDAMENIRKTSRANREHAPLLPAKRQLDVVEPGSGISLQGMTQVLRSLLGLEQRIIAGEIICSDDACSPEKSRLRLRVITSDGMSVHSVGTLDDRETDAYFRDSALKVLERIDPYIVAKYLHETSGDLKRARTIAMRLVVTNNEDAALAALLLGVLAHGERDYDAAMEWKERALEIAKEQGPEDFAEPLSSQASTLRELKQYDLGIEKARAALEIDPDLAHAWNEWGRILDRLHRHEEAMEKFIHLTTLEPTEAYPWNNWGSSLIDLGRYDEAREKLDLALVIDPDFGLAHANIGVALKEKRQFEDALKAFETAVQKDRDLTYAWHNWGRTLADMERYEAASEKHQRAVETDPAYHWGWASWGRALRLSGQPDAAIAKFDTATALDPNYAFAWHELGLALRDMGQTEVAAEKFKQAVMVDPDYHWAWGRWGQMLRQMDRPEEALEKFEKATALAPDYAFGWDQWGRALWDMEQTEAAIIKFRKAVAVDPNYHWSWMAWGRALSDDGQFEKAAEKFAQAAQVNATHRWAWYDWGQALEQLGDLEGAAEKYETAVRLDPGLDRVWNGWLAMVARALEKAPEEGCELGWHMEDVAFDIEDGMPDQTVDTLDEMLSGLDSKCPVVAIEPVVIPQD